LTYRILYFLSSSSFSFSETKLDLKRSHLSATTGGLFLTPFFPSQYIRSCDVCQHNKIIRHKKYGHLKPLEVPIRPWKAISMDFIIGLPKSDRDMKRWVMVDRLAKMVHFIPLKTEEYTVMINKSVHQPHPHPPSLRDKAFLHNTLPTPAFGFFFQITTNK